MAKTLPTIFAAAAAALLLVGCGTAAPEAAEGAAPAAETEGEWPREITHEAGETTIDEKPLRIVSTSPSITGSLLALEAPLIATGAAAPTPLTDDKGFFTQWADVADERGVEVAYANLTLDIDAIDQFEPDLIIGSSNGGDATLEAYDQLSEIAPTVLLDYGNHTWQGLTTELGKITGLEQQASDVLAEYDEWVAGEAKKIELPEQPVTGLVYMGAEGAWAYTPSSPQAQLIQSLGFTYEQVDQDLKADGQKGGEIDVLTSENMANGLANAKSIFVVAMGGGDAVGDFSADPLLANQPAVAEDRVFTLGTQAFRLDYYSAKLTVELVVDTFSK